jgi:hypothetical protein
MVHFVPPPPKKSWKKYYLGRNHLKTAYNSLHITSINKTEANTKKSSKSSKILAIFTKNELQIVLYVCMYNFQNIISPLPAKLTGHFYFAMLCSIPEQMPLVIYSIDYWNESFFLLPAMLSQGCHKATWISQTWHFALCWQLYPNYKVRIGCSDTPSSPRLYFF